MELLTEILLIIRGLIQTAVGIVGLFLLTTALLGSSDCMTPLEADTGQDICADHDVVRTSENITRAVVGGTLLIAAYMDGNRTRVESD